MFRGHLRMQHLLIHSRPEDRIPLVLLMLGWNVSVCERYLEHGGAPEQLLILRSRLPRGALRIHKRPCGRGMPVLWHALRLVQSEDGVRVVHG